MSIEFKMEDIPPATVGAAGIGTAGTPARNPGGAGRYTFRPVLMKFTFLKRAGALPCETGATCPGCALPQ